MLLAISLLLFNCSRNEITPPGSATASLTIAHEVDGDALAFDQLRYENDAGTKFSVSRLEYYISDIRLLSSDDQVYAHQDIVYVNAQNPETQTIRLEAVPPGNYKSMSFYIGLLPKHNCSRCLPATLENLNMAWPDGMGGGYHFLKMEGKYREASSSATAGYAMHSGTAAGLTEVMIEKDFHISAGGQDLKLRMNINEWFRNPELYDFNTDGNYIMGDAAKMSKLARNGASVFSLD